MKILNKKRIFIARFERLELLWLDKFCFSSKNIVKKLTVTYVQYFFNLILILDCKQCACQSLYC